MEIMLMEVLLIFRLRFLKAVTISKFYDSYGDGICCSYGSGSYTLSNGNNMIVSGGNFGSGESTSFCVGNNLRSITSTESISSEIESAGFNVYPNPAITELEIFTGKMEASAYQNHFTFRKNRTEREIKCKI